MSLRSNGESNGEFNDGSNGGPNGEPNGGDGRLHAVSNSGANAESKPSANRCDLLLSREPDCL